MNCCIHCFKSDYLNRIIIGNKIIGNCDYCKSKDVNIYDSSELNIFFKGILDLYKINPNGKPIEEQIVDDFPDKVFTVLLIKTPNIKQLLIDIIQDDFSEYEELFTNPVKLECLSSEIEEVIIKPLSLSWDNFADEIKSVNRFHFVNALDLEKLKSLLKHFEKEIPKGKKYYRARITSSRTSYPKKEMGNPPNHLAKSGRANPTGISYLYLANDVTTTLYEARASLFDYVSVGTFRLEENLKVVNLNRTTYDVFRLAELETLEEVLIHSSFVDKLEQELSKPRRKNDSELDYLPTQYLSELIKSMGFDGIEFRSSLYSDGHNVAIFYPEKFKCLDVALYDIVDIKIDYKKL